MQPNWVDPGGWVLDPECTSLGPASPAYGFEPRRRTEVPPEAERPVVVRNIDLVYERGVAPSSLLTTAHTGCRRCLFGARGVRVRCCLLCARGPASSPSWASLHASLVSTCGAAGERAPPMALQVCGRQQRAPFDSGRRCIQVAQDDGLLWLSVDLTKYYWFLPLGPVASELCAFSIRASSLHGRRQGRRRRHGCGSRGARAAGAAGRHWRKFLCVPFGQLRRWRASAVSGEMSSMLLVANNYFVDDDLLVCRGFRRSTAAKQLAPQLACWLGFQVSEKSEAPRGPSNIWGCGSHDVRSAAPRTHRHICERSCSSCGSSSRPRSSASCVSVVVLAGRMRGADTFCRNRSTS